MDDRPSARRRYRRPSVRDASAATRARWRPSGAHRKVRDRCDGTAVEDGAQLNARTALDRARETSADFPRGRRPIRRYLPPPSSCPSRGTNEKEETVTLTRIEPPVLHH